MAIEIQQVESVEARILRCFFAPTPAKRTLQRPEVRAALGIRDDGFPIENGRSDAKLARSGGDCRKPVGPVMTATGDDPYRVRFDVNCNTPAGTAG
jgi:hypothetical protein